MSYPLLAHRKVVLGSGFGVLPLWEPIAGNRETTAKIAYMPSIGMAYALGMYPIDLNGQPDSLAVDLAGRFLLTPYGKGRMTGIPVLPPRFLIVRGFSGDPFPTSNFEPLYDDLKSLGVSIIADSQNTFRQHSDVVPAASYSEIQRSGHGGSGDYFRQVVVAEPDNYIGGEVFIAQVQLGPFGFISPSSYTAVIGNTQSVDDYSTLATGTMGQVKLIANATDPQYDEDLCKIEAAKYRRFQQKYYYPSGDYHAGSTDTIPDGWQVAFDSIKGSTHFFPGAALGFGDTSPDYDAAAAQIVADAVAFFS
jgi:hypothetical protein